MRLIIRRAVVRWKGGVQGGRRTLTTDSGMLKRVRIPRELRPSLNSHADPAELIAAAHATSFSLALSKELGLMTSGQGEVTTSVTVTLEHLAEGWTIVNMHLDVHASLPKLTQGRFIEATICAKTSCLVSRLLRANISMNARLEN